MFPPEINSGLMYAGPGSGALTAAASAWHGLAENLTSTGSSVSSVASGLQGPWAGPSAEAMMSAVTPFVSWLHGTAAQATQMGAQATAAASAYETAHSAVVPPPAIAANRAQLMSLIATNFFGQNTPAIMATEHQYEGYWAQDGAAMDTYQAAQQNNMESLQKPTQPPQAANNNSATPAQATDPSNAIAQPLSSDGGSSMAAAPTPPSDGGASSLGDLLGGGADGGLGGAAGQLAGPLSLATVPLRLLTVPFSILIRLLVTLATAGARGGAGAAGAAGLAGAGEGGGADALMANIGEFVDGKLQGAVGTLANHFTTATQAVTAKLGNAASLGQLKVPEAWSTASGVTRAAPVLPDAPASAPSLTSSSFPGGPFGQALMGALSGRGVSGMAAKAPKMIPKPQSGR
jgi:PPE-repeat protein